MQGGDQRRQILEGRAEGGARCRQVRNSSMWIQEARVGVWEARESEWAVNGLRVTVSLGP